MALKVLLLEDDPSKKNRLLALLNREKSLFADESFVVLANGAADLRVPDQYLLRPTNLNYLGLGPVISYDPQTLLNAGIYRLVPNNVQDVISKNYVVKEKLLTGYVQAAIDTDVGSNQLTGNVGVQVIRATQSSSGAIFFNGVATPTTPDKDASSPCSGGNPASRQSPET